MTPNLDGLPEFMKDRIVSVCEQRKQDGLMSVYTNQDGGQVTVYNASKTQKQKRDAKYKRHGQYVAG